jgi:hypothetical protein
MFRLAFSCYDCNRKTDHMFAEIGKSQLYHGKCLDCGRYVSIMCTQCDGNREVEEGENVEGHPNLCKYKCVNCGGYAGIGEKRIKPEK